MQFSVCFLIKAILVSVKGYLMVVLICISLMTNDIHVFVGCLCVFFGEMSIQVLCPLKKNYLFGFIESQLQHTGSVLRCTGSSLWHAGFSLVVVCGLSCPTPYGILIPWPGIVLYVGRWILNHWTIREVPLAPFEIVFFVVVGCKSSLYIVDTRPLSDTWFATVSSIF